MALSNTSSVPGKSTSQPPSAPTRPVNVELRGANFRASVSNMWTSEDVEASPERGVKLRKLKGSVPPGSEMTLAPTPPLLAPPFSNRFEPAVVTFILHTGLELSQRAGNHASNDVS